MRVRRKFKLEKDDVLKPIFCLHLFNCKRVFTNDLERNFLMILST